MKNKTFKDIALPAIMLFLIAAVCTLLLAGTNLLTKDKNIKIIYLSLIQHIVDH